MRLFYKLILGVLLAAAVVVAYDVYQAGLGRPHAVARIRYDSADGRFTFRKPGEAVRIVYASMFGPGEPVMRVRNAWIGMFEEAYSDCLAAERGETIDPAEKGPFVRGLLREARKPLAEARRRLGRIDGMAKDAKRGQQIDQLAIWLEEREIYLVPLGAKATAEDKLAALRSLIEGLESLSASDDPSGEVDIAPLVVTVERRWQGRWVVSANRPRFLTGKEVPDVITGSRLELLALVQDDYAVPLDAPLAGRGVSPLDEPDSYGNPSRRWRDAFLPGILEVGKYDFLDAGKYPHVKNHVYMAPLLCYTQCIFYNEVMFRKAGIDKPPQTWPEFLEVCRKLKEAGFTPLTADQAVYSGMWMMRLVMRALGPEAWEGTIRGVPADKPPQERTSDPPWTDPRYKEIFTQIRQLHELGYFDPSFRGSSWPAAQREFCKGSAAMMICGAWLVQETAGYTTAGAEQFKLNCFRFPTWPGGREIDQQAAVVDPAGMMVCRQGGATAHAIELVKYLSAKDHPDMVHKNAQISAMKDADFSVDLAGIAESFQNAPVKYSRVPDVYAPRFNAITLTPQLNRFFLQQPGDNDYRTADLFLQDLQAATESYLSGGGEEGYE